MQVQGPETTSTVAHGDDTCTADEDGLFTVPDEVGQYLTQFPGWTVFTGIPEEPETEVDQLKARIAELEKAAEHKPPRKAPAKSTH